MQSTQVTKAHPDDLIRFTCRLAWTRSVFRFQPSASSSSAAANNGLPDRPVFAGFLMHSLLGIGLRVHNCRINPRCTAACARPGECAYGALMEAHPPPSGSPLAAVARSPAPLAIDAPWEQWSRDTRDGEFVVYLLGRASEHASAVASAMHDSSGGRITQVESSAGSAQGWIVAPGSIGEATAPARIRLVLRTPMRIVRNKKELADFDLPSLIRDGCFRIAVWGHHYHGLDWPAPWAFLEDSLSQVHVLGQDTRLIRFQRYSGRQRQVIPMRGLLGTITLDKLSPALHLVLKLSEICGIGKGATIGLGRISVLPAT
jgi:hypothetical protein